MKFRFSFFLVQKKKLKIKHAHEISSWTSKGRQKQAKYQFSIASRINLL
ncbi:hypothetical protein AsAng_0047250 [Aureispira anguillae]|uniref:Uncharacterized protein n=1 Tax=Aureispira anguillae TaxID=2864201 RepID=A0A916DVP9_9BACT|nr:hypothetical protein AsAng_0047250 [Aureispira anguillae]